MRQRHRRSTTVMISILLRGGQLPQRRGQAVFAGVARQGVPLRAEFGDLGVEAAEPGFQIRLALGKVLHFVEQDPVRADGLGVLAPERVPALLGGREQGAAALAADRLPDLRLQRGRDRPPPAAHAEGAVRRALLHPEQAEDALVLLRLRPPLAGRREAEHPGQALLDRVAREALAAGADQLRFRPLAEGLPQPPGRAPELEVERHLRPDRLAVGQHGLGGLAADPVLLEQRRPHGCEQGRLPGFVVANDDVQAVREAVHDQVVDLAEGADLDAPQPQHGLQPPWRGRAAPRWSR